MDQLKGQKKLGIKALMQPLVNHTYVDDKYTQFLSSNKFDKVITVRTVVCVTSVIRVLFCYYIKLH